MSAAVNTDVLARLERAAREKVAAYPALVPALLAGGAGVLAGGALASGLTHSRDEEARQRAGNVGFGAGVATGLAGPQIVDALHALQHRGAQ
jgi:hypothetical protein